MYARNTKHYSQHLHHSVSESSKLQLQIQHPNSFNLSNVITMACQVFYDDQTRTTWLKVQFQLHPEPLRSDIAKVYVRIVVIVCCRMTDADGLLK